MLALVLMILVAAPSARAACCKLDYLLVDGPNMHEVEIDGEPFEAQLETWEKGLQWRVFNNQRRSQVRPTGVLGRGFLVEYVLHESPDGHVVRLRELVYPEAESGPVAFVIPNQVAQIADDDYQQIDSGWTDFPSGAADALLDAVKGDAESSPIAWQLYWTLATLALIYIIRGIRSERDLAPNWQSV